LTRSTFKLRGLKANNILDGEYFVDGAVERLVLEWKVTRGRWIDKRDGVVVEELAPAIDNILRRAGSSNYKPQSVPGMSGHEYFLLSHTLAPFESDGPEDNQEWNLFDSYLSTNEENLHERHNLSNMLQRWQNDQVGEISYYSSSINQSAFCLFLRPLVILYSLGTSLFF
jgi:hypothetical protein